MSTVLLTEQGTPVTPTTGKVRIFVNTAGTVCSVDDTGTVTVYAAGITPEQVMDIIGATLTDTSSIDFTYNDAGDQINASVIPAGVDHNSLANLTVGNPHSQYLQTSTAASTYQPLDTDLTALAGLTGTGLVARTATGVATTRTLVAGTGISISNGDGVSGNPSINSTITQFTVEDAQDAIGGILVDTASVNLTYDDVGNSINAAVLPAGVNHDALQNFVANEHIDHSAVSITAGTGLSGGGDLTATRNLNIANTGVTAGTYGSALVYPVVTVNAQGQLTAVSTQSVPGGALSAVKASASTNNTNLTFTNLADMAITLVANTTYYINYTFIGQSALQANGLVFSFGGGTLTPSSTRGYIETGISTTVANRLNFTSHTATLQFSGVSVVNTDQLVNAELIIVVGATGGTFIPQFRSENLGTTVTIQANSSVIADSL